MHDPRYRSLCCPVANLSQFKYIWIINRHIKKLFSSCLFLDFPMGAKQDNKLSKSEAQMRIIERITAIAAKYKSTHQRPPQLANRTTKGNLLRQNYNFANNTERKHKKKRGSCSGNLPIDLNVLKRRIQQRTGQPYHTKKKCVVVGWQFTYSFSLECDSVEHCAKRLHNIRCHELLYILAEMSLRVHFTNIRNCELLFRQLLFVLNSLVVILGKLKHFL